MDGSAGNGSGARHYIRAPDPLPADPSMREDEPLVEDGGREDVDDLRTHLISEYVLSLILTKASPA
jgi:hypothetical protein